MSTKKLSNVKLDDYILFLERVGCKRIRVNGGHHIYARKGLMRPIVVQTHVDPVPEFIIRNALRSLGLSKKDFFETLFKK